MMKTLSILFAALGLVLSAQGQGLHNILSERANWPTDIEVTQDVLEAQVFSINGEQLKSLPVRKGSYPLHGVFGQGVGLKAGDLVVFVPPERTNIAAEIEASKARKLAAAKAAAAPASKKAGLAALVDDKLIDSTGKARSRDELAGKYVGLYFSAHWCPPCRAFTPKLVDFRNANAADFEVIFVSSDHSADAAMKYMRDAKMNWLATPHGSEAGFKLMREFSVRGIPQLIILSPEGKVVSANGRGDVMGRGKDAMTYWKSR